MIQLSSSNGQASKYKRLLQSEWGKDFPDEVLSLLWSTLGAKANSEDASLLTLLDPSTNGSFPADYFRSSLESVADVRRFFILRGLPELPTSYEPPRRPSKSSLQAIRLSAYLTLPAHTKLSGDVGFFRDVQSLAVQAAIHFVLPALRDKHPAEHSLLLHAAALFPLEYYASDPAHFCYLISMLHGYLGNVDERLRFLYSAFRLTPPDDHSFLTKAQEYWSELLDSNRPEDAEEFLFSLHWWALPDQQDEVRAMMSSAFKEILGSGASS